MQVQEPDHQAPLPVWNPSPEGVQRDRALENDALRARIGELEQTVESYESLLSELPELFERKFQQRLEPLMERYRLLARAQQMLDEPALPLIEEPSEPLTWSRRAARRGSPSNPRSAGLTACLEAPLLPRRGCAASDTRRRLRLSRQRVGNLCVAGVATWPPSRTRP